MQSFQRFYEEFVQFDSQIARKGSGPSVAGAAMGGALQKPSQVETPIVGDHTSFSGNNVFLMKDAKIPFDVRIEEENDMFSIYIRTKGDDKFIPLSKTKFAERTECDFAEEEEAKAAVRDLIFRISQVEIPRK